MAALDAEFYESKPLRDTVESLFQPDTIASAEYFDGRRRSALEPEKELVLALIEDAVFCFKKYLGSKREKEQRLYSDAEEWIFSDDREWPLSFLNVCDLLGLEPDYMRGGLLRWQKDIPGAKAAAKAGTSKPEIEIKKEEESDGRRKKGSPAPPLKISGAADRYVS
jgi:hypothetical protein